MRKNIILGILSALFLYPGAGRGQDSLNVRIAGSVFDYWSLAVDVAACGNYAYLLTKYSGIEVMYVELPEHPRYLYNVPVMGECTDIDREGNFLYIANSIGLFVLDITDPANVVLAAQLTIPGGLTCLDAVGDNIYGGINAKVHFIDNSNPYEPILSYTYIDEYSSFNNISVEEQYLYTRGSYLNLVIYDISIPEATHTTGQIFYEYESFVYYNGFVYLAGIFNSEIVIYNVSDPSNPIQAGVFEVEHCEGLYYGDVKLFASAIQGTSILDVDNPINPILMGTIDESMGDKMYLEDGILYSAYGYYGFKMASVIHPTAPFLFCELDSSNNIGVCEANDSVAFVMNEYKTLTTIDMNNPFEPEIISVFTYPHNFSRMTIAGNVLYVYEDDHIIKAFNISNPENVNIIAYGSIPSNFNCEIAVSESYAYAVDVFGEFFVFTLPQGASMVLYGAYDINGGGVCIAAKGEHAFVGNSSLVVMDAALPYYPSPVATVPNCNFNDMEIQGDYLFGVGNTIKVLSILNPHSPQIIDSQSAPEPLIKVDVCGDLLAAAGLSGKVWIYDISNLSNIELVGYYYTYGKVTDLAFCGNGNYLFASNSYNCITLDCSQLVSIAELPEDNTPESFDLLSCYPNPFNNSTTITFDLPESGEVSLKVYDISGREVAEIGVRNSEFGESSVVWDAEGQASGVYFVRLEAGNNMQTRKIVLLK